MLQFIAAIPTIFSAISNVTELFKKGREKKEEITGTPSIASTPEELQEEISSLSLEQKNKWAELMQNELNMYKAQNERLALEIGLIDSNITSKLTVEDAGKIAVMRQTTRPWAVRMMVHYVFFPFYLIIVDIIQEIIKTWLLFWTDKIEPFKTFDYVFGTINPSSLSKVDPSVMDKVISMFKDKPHTLAGDMYIDSIPWVVGIVVSYMGLREIGKAKGTSGDESTSNVAKINKSPLNVIGSTVDKGIDLVSKVKKIFNR